MAAVALLLLLGATAGFFAVFDTPISWSLSHLNHITILGKSAFELYPYEVSSLFFASLLVVYLLRNVPKGFFLEKEKYYIVALLATYETFSLHKFGPIDGSDLVIAFSIISFFVVGSIQREKMTYQFVDILNLLLLMALVISAVNAGYAGVFTMTNGFLKGAKVFFLSFLLVNSVARTGPRFFMRWLLILTTVSAAVGIIQEIVYVFSGTLIIGAVDARDLKNSLDTFMGIPIFRVSAFTAGYKFFSALLVSCILIELNLLLYHKMQKKTVLLMLVSMFFMGIALFFTFSKDSWLVCFLFIAISFFVRWPFLLIYFVIISLFAIGALALTHYPNDLWDSFLKEVKWQEYRIRIQLASEGIKGILRHPFIGYGFKRAPLYTGNFHGWPPHNLFITAVDETGLFGFSAYLLLIGFTIYKGFSSILVARGSYDIAISKGILFCFVSYLVLMQFEPGFMDITLWILIGFIHGIFIFRAKTIREGRPDMQEVSYKSL